MKVTEIRNGNVRCVGYKTSERYFTLGKVYEVKDDKITNDHGFTYTIHNVLYYLSDWYEFEPVVEDKIVITHDGKTTTATKYCGDGSKVTATARCAPEDEFNFEVGAKLALERLDEKANGEFEWVVVKRNAKVGDYIRLKNNGGYPWNEVGDILRVDEVGCGTVVYVLGKNHIRKIDDANFAWSYVAPEYEVVEKRRKVETPKYYNGKVVCIKSGYSWWTVGKIYEVKDGYITADDDCRYPNEGEPYRDLEDVRHAGNSENTTGDGRHNPKNEFIPLVE